MSDTPPTPDPETPLTDRPDPVLDEGPAPAALPDTARQGETRGERFARKAHRFRLYVFAFATIAVIAYIVALAVSNTGRVRINWVFGSGSVRLIWLVLIAAVLGWLLGILIAAVFRWRTRAPRPPRVR